MDHKHRWRRKIKNAIYESYPLHLGRPFRYDRLWLIVQCSEKRFEKLFSEFSPNVQYQFSKLSFFRLSLFLFLFQLLKNRNNKTFNFIQKLLIRLFYGFNVLGHVTVSMRSEKSFIIAFSPRQRRAKKIMGLVGEARLAHETLFFVNVKNSPQLSKPRQFISETLVANQPRSEQIFSQWKLFSYRKI